MEMRRRGSYTVYQIEKPPDRNAKSHSNVKVMDIPAYFESLVACMKFLGFLTLERKKHSHLLSEKIRVTALKTVRTIYLILMWVWTILMSINIFWLAIAETTEDGVSPVDGQHANMIITLLNETPYAFITIRNAVILSLFVSNGPRLIDAIQWCEDLRCKIAFFGVNVSMEKCAGRPLQVIVATVMVIVLWEVHEWNVWFGTLGITYSWNFAPFPFALVHYFYASLWWAFTSLPFIFAQLALAFPVLFSHVARKYIKFLNHELKELALATSSDVGPELLRAELSQRLTKLRKLQFEINELIARIDKLIRAMLLWQFIFDVIVLFGFVGLLVNSKDVKPPKKTLEWTFFIPSSIIWFCFFLFYFNIPLIQMANEGEKTHNLVHVLTISSAWLHQEKHRDMHVFLEETKHSTTAFTGGNFYYINRHYIVTCFALLASEITVLAEILDRFYGTLEIKTEIKYLRKLMEDSATINNTTSHSSFEVTNHRPGWTEKG
ncbi:uncharacterized protein LOC129583913 [Paramacrobiotus metropolitanus]|uniref:uncharacterized protein LOC129583913 n=1 Tax=Paramacrobiotus metropolitanus TaxID=2943436 RepID=UPI0024464119|nr:uncharacterized protein LOC129583913 [Paramacrobiotus metropolitanus]